MPDGLASWASPSSLATGRPRGKDPGCSLLCVSGGFLSVPMSPGRNWPPEEFCLNPIKFRGFPHNWEIPPHVFSLQLTKIRKTRLSEFGGDTNSFIIKRELK